MRIDENEIELDAHSHTIASGHAYGTIREMAREAAEKGLKLLGICEHTPDIPGACDTIYFHNLEVVPRTLCGVEILLGAELNILKGGEFSLGERELAMLDYRCAGVHGLCYELGTKAENTKDVLAALESPWLDILVHPDERAVELDYGQLVPAAAEHHVLLELNNSSLGHKVKGARCVENYLEMLELCKRYRAPVIFGSDAHDPSGVKSFQRLYDLFLQVEFPRELIMNLDKSAFLAFLERKHAGI